MKEQIKKHLIAKLKIAGFVFASAGWIMLIAVPFEFMGFNFSRLESFIKTPVFNWGLKIFIVILLIFLLKGQKIIDGFIERHSWLKPVLKIIFWGGIMGWVLGLTSLFFR